MYNEFVITRTVSGRRKFYCGQKNGKPVFATAAAIDSERFGTPNVAQAYTRRDNAERSANRLARIEDNRFWTDRRVGVSFIDVINANDVNIPVCAGR